MMIFVSQNQLISHRRLHVLIIQICLHVEGQRMIVNGLLQSRNVQQVVLLFLQTVQVLPMRALVIGRLTVSMWEEGVKKSILESI